MNKWEKYVKEHNKKFLQIPFQLFRFSRNDLVVIILAEILDVLMETNEKGFIFFSKSDLIKRHEIDNEDKIFLCLKTLVHRKIINKFVVLNKFGENGDKIRIDLNDRNFKGILQNEKPLGAKQDYYDLLQTKQQEKKKFFINKGQSKGKNKSSK